MIVECVPNFSEGRDPAIICRLARAVGEILLDVTSDLDHNRTVLTFAGAPRAVAAAALAAARVAVELIHLQKHTGVHPRMGAVDVIPFVPLHGISLAECADLSKEVAARLWHELRLPVYLYEAAGTRSLEQIRRQAAEILPAFGAGRHPTAGACVVGARRILIAWNINLKSTDLKVARDIARTIRASSGGLRAVKALGFPLASRGQVQVSVNLVDFRVTPLHVVFETVARECHERGVQIAGTELIGMIPAAALKASAGYDLKWLNLRPDLVLDDRLGVSLDE